MERLKKAIEAAKQNEKDIRTTAHLMSKGDGMDVHLILEDDEAVSWIAKILGIPDGWKLMKFGRSGVAYNKGDRLTFFKDARDFVDENKK
jgi:hypothetical protein